MEQRASKAYGSKEVNLRDPKVRADLYMQTHGIKELFQGLGTLLLFHRPDDPRSFLAQHLEEMRAAKQARTHVRIDALHRHSLASDGGIPDEHPGSVLCRARLGGYVCRVRRHGSRVRHHTAIRPRWVASSRRVTEGELDHSSHRVMPALLNLGIDQPTMRMPDSVAAVDQSLFVRSLYVASPSARMQCILV